MRASEIKDKLGISNYELSKLREAGALNYTKINPTRYDYSINEELIKPFLSGGKVNKNLSTTSNIDDIESNLSGTNLDIPSYNEYNSINSYNKKAKRISKWMERDSYIRTYRRLSLTPKVDSSIDEIVNEIAQPFDDGNLVKIDFTDKIEENTAKAVSDSFNKILNLLDFNNTADELIRDWYVDGGLPIETLYNNKNIRDGIVGILKLSPIGLKEIVDESNNKKYYTYKESLTSNTYSPRDSKNYYKEEEFIYIGSGKWDEDKIYQTSYMRVALKSINDLSYIENAIIKYRITRASEKNIWNIDVGSMSTNKAKNHIQSVSREVSSNIKYDTTTGEVNVDPVEGITSDWIFPSRNGKQKTEVTTINGNADFVSKLEDLLYFKKSLYEALKIPVGRLDSESSFDYSSEDILREELKFTHFTNKLKRSFSELFYELLRRDLSSTNKVPEDDFNKIKNEIKIKWNSSNVIVEKARINNIKFKAESVSELKDSGIVGTIISNKYLISNVMNMTDAEYKEQLELIEEEKKLGMYKEED